MTYRPERAPLVSVHKLKIKCPVCEHRDNCAVSEDRRIAFCRRVRSAKPGRGGWTHILTNDPPLTRMVRAQPAKQTPLASIEQRHTAYVTLLREHLVCAAGHAQKLEARGFSEFERERNAYRSTPPLAFADNIARSLDWRGLAGVPGFYREDGRWRMVNCRAGFFVPYRDERGRIQAMQYRLDEPLHGKTKYLWLSSADRPGGASSGAPVHHAYHHLLAEADEITISEGALKSDVIAYLTQQPVIGIAGVATFGADFAAHLHECAPRLRRVIVAYDRDLVEKKEVRHALTQLCAQLTRARFQVRVRTWPAPWKGYDDFLLAQCRQEAQAA